MKIKVLIAEDEQIERDFLKKLLNDNFPKIDVLSAANGQEAVDLFQQHGPQIVLIDINMPLKDGLTSLQEMKQSTNEDFISIILTSYNDFSFAQRGIQLHVSDYILKPAEPKQICTQISQALETLQDNFNYRSSLSKLNEQMKETYALIEPDFVYAILNQTDETSILDYLRSRQISGSNAVCLLLSCSINHEVKYIKNIIYDCGYECISAKSNDLHILYMFSATEIKSADINKIQKTLEPFFKEYSIQSAWGNPKNSINTFRVSYLEAKKQLEMYAKQANPISEQQFVERTVNELLQHVEDNQISIVLHDFVSFLMEYSIEEKRQIFKQVLHELYRYAFQNGISNLNEPDYSKLTIFSKNDTLNKAVYITTQYFLDVLKPIKQHQYEKHSVIYKKAILFIQQNYKRSIGLNDVGKALDVSPYYISRILSKEGGPDNKSFVEILTAYRIEESKRLIQQYISLKDVAYQVGFHSLSYFSKCFKKSTGITPKEYQNLFNSIT